MYADCASAATVRRPRRCPSSSATFAASPRFPNRFRRRCALPPPPLPLFQWGLRSLFDFCPSREGSKGPCQVAFRSRNGRLDGAELPRKCGDFCPSQEGSNHAPVALETRRRSSSSCSATTSSPCRRSSRRVAGPSASTSATRSWCGPARRQRRRRARPEGIVALEGRKPFGVCVLTVSRWPVAHGSSHSLSLPPLEGDGRPVA